MDDLFNIAGKVALVTGASAGLGARFAEVLAGAGAEVILAARREEALAVVAERISAAGGTCSITALDVSSSASIAAIEPLLARVDILVNNAGVAIDKPFLDQTEADWDVVIDTNSKGIFLLTQAIARAARERGRGASVINIASVLGLRQGAQVAGYAISKAATIQLTKISALELARFGVRVNAIAPGYFETDMTSAVWETEGGKAIIKRIPQRRLGRTGELDGILLLLASDASSYMTGSVIAADGGHLVSTL